jgi:prepilin peptidase CpaA
MTLEAATLAATLTAGAACVTDLRTRRIPNLLTFGSAATALLFHGATGGLPGLGLAFGGWSVGLVLFLPVFLLRGLGAGDVKLLAALGAWLGPSLALWTGLYTAIAGGVLALAVAAGHGYLRKAFQNIFLVLTHWRVIGVRPIASLSLEQAEGPRLAYAVPIAVGLLVALWRR